ncbi:MAG TPA: hypothetical protein VE684_10720 [Crenalkalicoccus sp.]|nr:hypothetical protein [Crenalkalicoccus sp.]
MQALKGVVEEPLSLML